MCSSDLYSFNTKQNQPYTGTVTFSFEGMDKFTEDIEFVDNKTGKRTKITESNKEVIVENLGTEENRFFVSFNRASTGIDDITDSSINVYSPNAGVILVTSSESDVIEKVEIFSTDGKLINAKQKINSSIYQTNVVAGNYIVKVQTANKTNSFKISVR